LLPVPTADITKPTSVVLRASQEEKDGDGLKVRKKVKGEAQGIKEDEGKKLSRYRPWTGPWGSRRLRLQNF
jgi:hypothetical protein